MSAEEEIRIEVTRDKRDYFSAIWANYLYGGGIWWAVGGALVFFLVILALAISDGDPRPWAAGGAAAFIFIVVIVPLNALIIYLTAARSASQPGALDPISYVFTAEAIEVKSAIGSGVTKWLAWRRAFETSRVLVIRHHVNIMQFLPTRQIPTETLSRLRKLLRRALAGRVSFRQERPV